MMMMMMMMQLVPVYRVYTVDSLKKLSFLDDLPVTVDERLQHRDVSAVDCKSPLTAWTTVTRC